MKRILRNWKTTLFGIIGGLPLLVEGIIEKNPVKIVSASGVIITGALAKDGDKTGL